MDVAGRTIDFDQEGFMSDPTAWDDQIAAAIALEEGIDQLSETHWGVVNFIRSYWQEHDLAPPVRMICKEVGVSVREIYKLFTSGPARGACRVEHPIL